MKCLQELDPIASAASSAWPVGQHPAVTGARMRHCPRDLTSQLPSENQPGCNGAVWMFSVYLQLLLTILLVILSLDSVYLVTNSFTQSSGGSTIQENGAIVVYIQIVSLGG